MASSSRTDLSTYLQYGACVGAAAAGAAFLWWGYRRYRRAGHTPVTASDVWRGRVRGDVKMMLALNRSLPPPYVGKSARNTICLCTSTASVELLARLRHMEQDDAFAPILHHWLTWGHMKVAVKCPTTAELVRIYERCRSHGRLRAILMRAGECGLPNAGGESDGPPAVVCVLGEAAVLDEITGHLKLL